MHEQRSVLAPDNLTPRLDPAAAPGERPAFVSSGHRMMHEDRAEQEYAAALEKSQRTGKPMEIDVRGRPILPKWPLLSGIVPFLFTSGVLVRWLAISVALYASGWILLSGLAMAMTGGLGAIAGMCFFAIGCVFTMLAASAAAGALLQIVTESAVGNREIENWPSLLDWFGSLLFLGVSGIMSAVPGSAISLIPPLHSNPNWSALAIGLGIAICLAGDDPFAAPHQLHLGHLVPSNSWESGSMSVLLGVVLFGNVRAFGHLRRGNGLHCRQQPNDYALVDAAFCGRNDDSRALTWPTRLASQ